MGLFTFAIIATVRGRIASSHNFAEALNARALSEAGLNLWQLRLATDPRSVIPESYRRQPVLCAMPGGAVAAIAIEDESGKIDLNAAPVGLLERLLQGVGASPQEATQLAAEIGRFSHSDSADPHPEQTVAAYRAAGRIFGPKRAPFETILELDQVLGISQERFHALMPFLTMHSRQPGFDPRFAPPQLLTLIERVAGRSDAAAAIHSSPAEHLARSPRRMYLIHSEVLTAGGALASRQAIVELASGRAPIVLHEIRRGTPRFEDVLRSALEQGRSGRLPLCQ